MLSPGCIFSFEYNTKDSQVICYISFSAIVIINTPSTGPHPYISLSYQVFTGRVEDERVKIHQKNA